MSNQEQHTSNIQNPNHPFYNSEWDGNSSREGKVQAHQDHILAPFILIKPTDNKGPLTDASGTPTTHDWTGARCLHDSLLTVKDEMLKAAIEENGRQEIESCDYVRLEYSGDKLIKITKIDPSKK